MSALRKAQYEHDELLPPPVSETADELARSEWLYNAAEQLVRFGCDVMFKCSMRKPQGVTVAQLALAADEFVNSRQAGCEIGTPALGWLLIANKRGYVDNVSTEELLGPSNHPLGKLWEIAEGLLRPLADDALIAQAEDNEL